MKLTPAGKVLMDYARQLGLLAAEAEAAVKDPTPRGNLRLGSQESTAAIRLPPLIARYSEAWPEVRFSLTTGNPVRMSAALASGEVDAAFFVWDGADERFEGIPAYEEQVVLAAPRGMGERPTTMLVFEDGCPHGLVATRWLADRGWSDTRKIELNNYHAMLGCVAAGMGAAVMPAMVVPSTAEGSAIDTRAMPAPYDRLTTSLVWRRGAASPAVRALAGMFAA